MNAKIRINPIAATDLQEIKNFISEDNVNSATKVVSGIIKKIESLSSFPNISKMLLYKIKLKSKYRYIIYDQYIIFYIYEDNIVSVQRILHGKRDYLTLLKDSENNN
ncbi:type II toxin-antitoxin system RelE/ParE family toxin [Clostridium sp. C8]|uniref:Uncharacterized protein n=1 Tax=bioreactor metagenome TaxID=1076179 RepID=A0A644WAY1_9ZZZZ|nr:type II toxin-antitoxin system RelE/ParE family toxin [Clostridium sp. C8]KLE15048.1 hypothetical protein AAT22_13515 [Clostridium sp. C8]